MSETLSDLPPPNPPQDHLGLHFEPAVVAFLVGVILRPMDIEAFYDGDARRRPSAELELGTDWRDAQGVRYELNYVEDTGELYVMQEPPPHEWEDPFGGIHVEAFTESDESAMTVRVVASISSVESLHRILEGWEAAMNAENGAEWLAARLRAAGVAVVPPNPADG
jgi:hypothetical protein